MSDKTDLEKNGKSQSSLRYMAENQLSESPETIHELKEKDLEEIIHELRVHQIELEMQKPRAKENSTRIRRVRG